jgi:hypothetical protein
MKYILILGLLTLFTSTVFAQAADPDAIDFSAKMDTAIRWTDTYNIVSCLNIGLQNQDPWEDLEITIYPDGASYSHGEIRFGGSLITKPTTGLLVGGMPTLYGDLDGDGIGDLFTEDILWYKGKKEPPYFDPSSNAQLQFHDFPAPQIIGIGDYNKDGNNDLLASAGYGGVPLFIVYRFNGGSQIGQTSKIFASDSLVLKQQYYTAVGKFRPKQDPMLVLAVDRTIYLVTKLDDLAHDTIRLISDTTTSGILMKSMYVMDITGDGIPDLILSDGLYIYIFKGGDNFGTYTLSRNTAYYIIPSPRVLDFVNYGFIKDFGMHMRNCGDITGSGIPYLAVEAEINEAGFYKGFEFFYAGGKALDSLFDATMGFSDQVAIVSDTLHRINTLGRTACLIDNGRFSGGFDNELLLFNDCEKIPHVTNPQMVSVRSAINNQGFIAEAYPTLANAFVKLRIKSPEPLRGTITVYDLLGAIIEKRQVRFDSGENIEFFTTKNWMSGTYIVKTETERGIATTKIVIGH